MIFNLGCKRVCQYCTKTMGYKDGEGVTHGICEECLTEPYRREVICHAATCRVCGLVSLRIEDILIRCDEGRKMMSKWERALKAAKEIEGGPHGA